MGDQKRSSFTKNESDLVGYFPVFKKDLWGKCGDLSKGNPVMLVSGGYRNYT
jgi:hypothetical protein